MVLAHIGDQMRDAAARHAFERAAWLKRRHERLEALLGRLGGVLRAAHAGARLVLAPHPSATGRLDAFWLVGGRVVDWGTLPESTAEVHARTNEALRAVGAQLRPEEVDEVRLVGAWLAGHEVRSLELTAGVSPARVEGFVAAARTWRPADAGASRAA